MTRLFVIKPKHWWDYLSPSFYRRRKVLYAILDYKQKELDFLRNQAIENMILFGRSVIPTKWNKKSKGEK